MTTCENPYETLVVRVKGFVDSLGFGIRFLLVVFFSSLEHLVDQAVVLEGVEVSCDLSGEVVRGDQ